MRLIDADVLRENVFALTEHVGDERLHIDAVAHLIDGALTVDAVPVVRCKDCYHGSLQSNETKTYHCLKHNAMMEGHYFCNLGEREPPRQRYLICRKCGHGWFGKYNYCPNCGADMREDGDDGKAD